MLAFQGPVGTSPNRVEINFYYVLLWLKIKSAIITINNCAEWARQAEIAFRVAKGGITCHHDTTGQFNTRDQSFSQTILHDRYVSYEQSERRLPAVVFQSPGQSAWHRDLRRFDHEH